MARNFGNFNMFGSGQMPIWNTVTREDPDGREVTEQRFAGTATSSNPFTSTFGQSLAAMNNLGNTVGNNFAMANAWNRDSAERARDRNLVSSLLKNLMGSFNFGTNAGGGGSSVYGDFSSRQTAGGYRPDAGQGQYGGGTYY